MGSQKLLKKRINAPLESSDAQWDKVGQGLTRAWRWLHRNLGWLFLDFCGFYCLVHGLMFWIVCKEQQWVNPIVVAGDFNKFGMDIRTLAMALQVIGSGLLMIAVMCASIYCGIVGYLRAIPRDLNKLHQKVVKDLKKGR